MRVGIALSLLNAYIYSDRTDLKHARAGVDLNGLLSNAALVAPEVAAAITEATTRNAKLLSNAAAVNDGHNKHSDNGGAPNEPSPRQSVSSGDSARAAADAVFGGARAVVLGRLRGRIISGTSSGQNNEQNAEEPKNQIDFNAQTAILQIFGSAEVHHPSNGHAQPHQTTYGGVSAAATDAGLPHSIALLLALAGDGCRHESLLRLSGLSLHFVCFECYEMQWMKCDA